MKKSTLSTLTRLAAPLMTLALGAPLFAEGEVGGSETVVAPAAIEGVEPGGPGGVGLAIYAKKIICAEYKGRQVVNNGVMLVKDGKIQAVGSPKDVRVPDGYAVMNVGDKWLMPGLVEMHNHVAGKFGLNDMVYLANPGLRASADVVPKNALLKMGLAGGVTTVLYIPGSGTNVGGQGVMLRAGFEHYEDAEIRNPGSMKLAQAGNPERWLMRPQRSLMNFNTRTTFKRGIAYAKQWEAYEQDGGVKPRKDPQWEIFRHLRKRDCHISTHTQIYQVILKTVTLVHDELDLPFFVDHGTFDSWRLAPELEKREIFACLGPRNIDVPSAGFIRWSGSNPERIQGVVAGYQEMGHTRIGFNTDSPVIPQEELSVQATMAARYGFKDDNMDTLRGLTIIPAMAGGIGEIVGSLEKGKDADILVVTGDLTDPRNSVELVFSVGQVVYDPTKEGRRW
ncbi:MAG: imidazolonepropionase-like amidohydrolase [Planctomycetota bacterium]|jgi:imidazolonepropionase-like amidohydrolase